MHRCFLVKEKQKISKTETIPALNRNSVSPPGASSYYKSDVFAQLFSDNVPNYNSQQMPQVTNRIALFFPVLNV